MSDQPAPRVLTPEHQFTHQMALETVTTLFDVCGTDASKALAILTDALALVMVTAPADQLDAVLADIQQSLTTLVAAYRRRTTIMAVETPPPKPDES